MFEIIEIGGHSKKNICREHRSVDCISDLKPVWWFSGLPSCGSFLRADLPPTAPFTTPSLPPSTNPLTTPSPASPQSCPANALHTSHTELQIAEQHLHCTAVDQVLLKNDFPASTGLRFPPVRSQFYASISHIPCFSSNCPPYCSPLFTFYLSRKGQNNRSGHYWLVKTQEDTVVPKNIHPRPARSSQGPLGPLWAIWATLGHFGPLGPLSATLGHLGHYGPFGPHWATFGHLGHLAHSLPLWATLGHLAYY